MDRIAQIKEKYGRSVFINYDKSVNLKYIQIDNYDGTIFTPSCINITSTANIVQFSSETFNTPNHLGASDIIIAKSCWSTISEALLSRRNSLLVAREGVLDDTKNIEELRRRCVAFQSKRASWGDWV